MGRPGRYSVRGSRLPAHREIVAMLPEHAGDCFAPPGTGPQPPLTDLALAIGRRAG